MMAWAIVWGILGMFGGIWMASSVGALVGAIIGTVVGSIVGAVDPTAPVMGAILLCAAAVGGMCLLGGVRGGLDGTAAVLSLAVAWLGRQLAKSLSGK